MKNKSYLLLVLTHVLIGILIYLFRPLSKLYGISILIIGLYYIIKKKNINNEALYASAYLVGSEVFLRMTDGSPLYEISKYGVICFLILGMFFSGFSKNTLPFWIYLLLYIPGIIIATQNLNLETDIRITIAFNISGPICLGVAAIYCYQRKFLFSEMNNLLLTIGLPIISTSIYLILFTPELKTVLKGTGSNVATSGGFGPNQVATVLGLGMFIFFSRLIFHSKDKLIFILNLLIALNISYRGLLTFSRGGMVTGLLMIVILLLFLFINTRSYGKFKLLVFAFIAIIAIFFTWIFTANQTEGLIEKRYANKDANGRVKESKFSGREEIFQSEIDAFLDNPFLGIGAGKSLEVRQLATGEIIISHSEISRTLGEHGMLGIIALFIVFFTPFFLFLDNKENIYCFCFLIFWILTINHAAMRIAAPAFIYSLAILKLVIDKDPESIE